MQTDGVIKNKLKVNAVVSNAKAFFKVKEEFGSFDKYVWSFVDYKQIVHDFEKVEDLPAETEESKKISEDMKKRGFKFVGSKIIYNFMEAMGLVNDHFSYCSFKNGKIKSE